MDERREPPPDSGTGPEPIPAVSLSPVQAAQRARAVHARGCRQCADIDRQRCPVGEELWQAWTETLDEAYRQLHGGRP